jgi:Leucine-rich repeat (LRR) protein
MEQLEEQDPDHTVCTVVADGLGAVRALQPRLGQMLALTMLCLDNGNVSSLDFVTALPQLQVLSCCDNRITTLAPLARHSALQHLVLLRNNLEDFNELRNLSSLPQLRSIDLRYNELRGTPDFVALAYCLIPSLRFVDECPISRLVPRGQLLVTRQPWRTLSQLLEDAASASPPRS